MKVRFLDLIKGYKFIKEDDPKRFARKNVITCLRHDRVLLGTKILKRGVMMRGVNGFEEASYWFLRGRSEDGKSYDGRLAGVYTVNLKRKERNFQCLSVLLQPVSVEGEIREFSPGVMNILDDVGLLGEPPKVYKKYPFLRGSSYNLWNEILYSDVSRI